MSERVGGYKGDPPVGTYTGTKPGGARLESDRVGDYTIKPGGYRLDDPGTGGL